MKFLYHLVLPSLLSAALAADILSSSGFTNCDESSEIRVNHANITFDRTSGTVFFDVSGTSEKVQNVSAELVVTAYGQQVYSNSFDPCEKEISQLCPVPKGTFGANGSQVIPDNFLSQIPSIAFTIPDLDGQATLKLTGANNQSLGCVQAGVTNGKTMNVPAVPYVAAGVAVAALALSGFAALGSAGVMGAPAPAVSFTTVIGWFQTMQMNGMHSVNYPPIYRAFAKNFAFSGGLIPWDSMQTAIDNFRASTGGNLTVDSVAYLRNSSLIFSDGSGSSSSSSLSFAKRGLVNLLLRDITTNTGDNSTSTNGEVSNIAHGVGAYVEQLTIPQANTFMTVLMIFAIVIAAITVGILLLKVILEAWALFGSFPPRLTSFRKRYWMTLAKTVTHLILLLYGVWVLYCIFQFKNGDSWAAKVLAGVTLATFTAVLAFFTTKILVAARKFKKVEGDASQLYDDKQTWLKYSLFYDAYRQGYWWLFIPAIIYMFAKGCVLAISDGHGLTQTSGQLIIEALMLILLLWTRPFATKASQIINIFIQVVRVLSVVCILVFVEELGIAQTTQTITGVVLIAVQAALTGALAILIAVNAIIMMCRENPHRKKRKEAEKLKRECDNLTPLDPRNSLLHLPLDKEVSSYPLVSSPYMNKSGLYQSISNSTTNAAEGNGSKEHLLSNAVSMARTQPQPKTHTLPLTQATIASTPGAAIQRPYTPSIYSDTNRESRQPTIPLLGIVNESSTAAMSNAAGMQGRRQGQGQAHGHGHEHDYSAQTNPFHSRAVGRNLSQSRIQAPGQRQGLAPPRRQYPDQSPTRTQRGNLTAATPYTGYGGGVTTGGAQNFPRTYWGADGRGQEQRSQGRLGPQVDMGGRF